MSDSNDKKNAKDAFSVDGKVVVLSGAAGIIGTQVVKSFVQAGARVFAIDRDADLLADRLGSAHASLITCVADVAQRESLVAAHALLVARWGEADGLLNNAATKSENFFEPFETFPVNDWNEVMSVNLTGAMLCAQIFGHTAWHLSN